MESLEGEKLSFCIVVTKIDKANQKTISHNIKLLKQQVQKILGYLPEIIPSSSMKKSWKEAILWLIESIL